MKVKLGKYIHWIGPYQIADMIFFWVEKYPDPSTGIENRWDYRLHDRFGTWLASTWVADFCQWIHNKRRRTVKVHIDNYDVWGMDHTLSLIIYPMLVKLKSQKHGYGWVHDEDVPKELRSTQPGARDGLTNDHDWDNNAERRYEWLLDELIWTFEQLANDGNEDQFYDHSECRDQDISEFIDNLNNNVSRLKVDRVGLEAHQKRIANGLILFGKYFQTLWD